MLLGELEETTNICFVISIRHTGSSEPSCFTHQCLVSGMDRTNAVHSIDIHRSFHSGKGNQDDFSHLNDLPSCLKSMEGQMWKPLGKVTPQDPEDPEVRRIYARKPQDDQGNNLQVLNWGQGQKLSLTLGCPVSSSMLEPSQRSSLKEQHLSCLHPDYVVARRDLKASLNGYIVGDASGDRRYPSDDAIGKAHALDLVPSSSNNMSCVNNGLQNSKYLRPTQQLLDEFVHVSKAAGAGSDGLFKNDRFTGAAPKIGSWSLQLEHSKFDEKDVICYNQCSSEEKSVSNVRIRRLFALLDELDTRYERYCRQIDEVVSSFEVVAGIEAANSYTDVAIQAMSRHFFSLRNAIVAQIRACREPSLENLSRKTSVSVSRPVLPDQKSRQIRALQNLAMIQVQQVWRPLRGLPETSVAVLRAWLFEHFLHPYPNDNEKQMLASKTGLTRNQISNWFINARVRLWKPMIEEMYREEFAETSGDSNPSS